MAATPARSGKEYGTYCDKKRDKVTAIPVFIALAPKNIFVFRFSNKASPVFSTYISLWIWYQDAIPEAGI